MKYFTNESPYGTERENKIYLKDISGWEGTGLDTSRVLSIKIKRGKVRFREECDSYFYYNYSAEEAVELLEEAIDWIKKRAKL